MVVSDGGDLNEEVEREVEPGERPAAAAASVAAACGNKYTAAMERKKKMQQLEREKG